MSEKIKVGDVVKFKSSGPAGTKFVVEEIDDAGNATLVTENLGRITRTNQVNVVVLTFA